MDSYSVIIKPVLTEKSYAGIPNKRYTFVVKPDATKTQIASAVEEIFKVKVDKVNTISVRGKFKRQGKNTGYTSDYKKAIVSLSKDSKAIEFFEGLAN